MKNHQVWGGGSVIVADVTLNSTSVFKIDFKSVYLSSLISYSILNHHPHLKDCKILLTYFLAAISLPATG